MSFLYVKVLKFVIQDQLKAYYHFRKKKSWVFRDLGLLVSYLWKNPYRIYKNFANKRKIDPYGYGETPFSVWRVIFEAFPLSGSDFFVDLGAGRGRGVLFASYIYGIGALGVERIGEFVTKASRFQGEKARFICQDFENIDLQEATIVYFFGLLYEDENKNELKKLFSTLRKGAKVISVSFPLSEYLGEEWELVKKEEVNFPWGKTDLFIENKLSIN